jgi:hypothetical protein
MCAARNLERGIEVVNDYPKFSDLMGKTLKRVEQVGDERIEFETDDGETFALYHLQDCCESVTVEDVAGDFSDLVGVPILQAEETTSDEVPEDVKPTCWGSFTWTFYKMATVKGSVTIRWYGTSNGYYSESVEFAKLA